MTHTHDPYSYATGGRGTNSNISPIILPPTVNPARYAGVRIEVIGNGQTTPPEGLHIVKKNTKFKITATPNNNKWKFSHYQLDYNNNGYPNFNQNITQNVHIQAIFVKRPDNSLSLNPTLTSILK